jgi:hypothetical protein
VATEVESEIGSPISQPPPGIVYDIDGDLALAYFWIDFKLLGSTTLPGGSKH